MQLKQRIAKVHGGSLKWRRPVAAAKAAEQARFQRTIQERVADEGIIATSLQSQFWSLLSYMDVKRADRIFAQTMNQLSQEGRCMANAMATQNTRTRRQSDSNLRFRLRMLITEMSTDQWRIHQLTLRSSDDAKWTTVAGLIKASEGQVRIVNPKQARWVLFHLPPRQQPTSNLLKRNVQFRVAANGKPAAHGLVWLSRGAEDSIQHDALAAALAATSLEHSHRPAWDLQTVRLAAPPASAAINKEWRLHAQVSSIGQLLLTLGEDFSATDIELHWKSLEVVVEKKYKERSSRRNSTE